MMDDELFQSMARTLQMFLFMQKLIKYCGGGELYQARAEGISANVVELSVAANMEILSYS